VVSPAPADRAQVRYQTGDMGSAARRDSPRRNIGRKEREEGGVRGSSAVDSRAGVGRASPGAVEVVVPRGWSRVEVETRLPSLPPSMVGGVVVIRSKDV
jgi:hypothetical protein